MSEHLLKNLYRKKYFYKVTWIRSEKLLKDIPWLKREEHDFCMVGYRLPTLEEAEKFTGRIMYDRLFDKVIAVQEISRDIALSDFQMENWRSQKVFGAEEHRKSSLDDKIQSAFIDVAKSQSIPDGKTKSFEFKR